MESREITSNTGELDLQLVIEGEMKDGLLQIVASLQLTFLGSWSLNALSSMIRSCSGSLEVGIKTVETIRVDFETAPTLEKGL